MDHESFIYLQRYNVPREIDNLCQNILEKNPRNLHTFISRWAQGRTTGYRGGVAFLIVTELATNEEVSTNVVAAQHHAHHINTVKRGTPTSRATLVMLDEDGNPLATVPNITFYQEEGRSMLGHSDSAAVHCPLVSVPEEWAVCLCVPTGPQCCEIRKYSTAGQLLWTTTVDRAVSAMARDSLTGKLWVSYSGGSGAIYRAHHKAESLPSIPHVYSMSSVSCHRAVFFLTGPTVERRCLDTTSLIFVVHFDQWEGISSRYLPLLIQAGAETTWVVFTRRHAGLASLEKDPFPVQTSTVADSTKRGLAVKGGVPSMGLYHPSQTFAFETNTGTFLHPFEPHALSVQYRAACAHDTLRGGLWILVDDCRVQYYTTKGAQTVSFRVHSGINIAIGVDAKLGHVWLLNLAALSHRPRIYCFDPMAQSVHAQMDLQRTFPDMVRKCPAALRYSNTANAMEQGNFSECSNQMLQNQDSQKMQILVVVCPL